MRLGVCVPATVFDVLILPSTSNIDLLQLLAVSVQGADSGASSLSWLQSLHCFSCCCSSCRCSRLALTRWNLMARRDWNDRQPRNSGHDARPGRCYFPGGTKAWPCAQRLRVPGTSLNSIEWKPAIQSYSSSRWGPASLWSVWWLSIHTGSKIAARAAKAQLPASGWLWAG